MHISFKWRILIFLVGVEGKERNRHMSDGFEWFRYLWPHHVGIPVMGRCMYITLVSLALRDYRESLGEKNRKKKLSRRMTGGRRRRNNTCRKERFGWRACAIYPSAFHIISRLQDQNSELEDV